MIRSTRPGPVSLRLSVTDRCQLRCLYCMPPAGVKKLPRSQVLRFEEIVRLVGLVKSRFGLSKVHLTGGEPLLRTGVIDLVGMLAEQGVGEIALTTNGQLLAGAAAALKRAGLRRVNVSLDSLDSQTFARLTRGGRLERTLEGLAAAQESGLSPVKINMTVLRGINDHEVVRVARFGLARGWEVRFLELMPIGPAAGMFPEWFVPSARVAAALSGELDLCPLPQRLGASARVFRARDGDGREGRIGFISPHSEPFCRGCRRLRITASGRAVGCLALGVGADLRPLLRPWSPSSPARIVRAIRQALARKRRGGSFSTRNLMVHTGG